MELDWLEDFLALVQAGSFSRAAELRNITQPAFSRRIRALEQWVGVQLFDRNARRVQLTPAGKTLSPEIQDIVRRIYAAREQARETADASSSRLQILATHVLSSTFFPGWMREIEKRHIIDSPISLMADNQADCEQKMLRGEAHFLLCHNHAAARTPLAPEHFESLIIGADTLIAVSKPRDDGDGPLHPLAESAAMLEYSSTSGMGRIVEATTTSSGAPPPTFVSPLASVLYAMARSGKGAAWLPESLIAPSLEAGELVRAASPDSDIPIEIRIYRPIATQSDAAERFWEAAQAART